MVDCIRIERILKTGCSLVPFSDHNFPKLTFSSRKVTILIVRSEKIAKFWCFFTRQINSNTKFSFKITRSKIHNFPVSSKIPYCSCKNETNSSSFRYYFFFSSSVHWYQPPGTHKTIRIVEPVFNHPKMHKDSPIGQLMSTGTNYQFIL